MSIKTIITDNSLASATIGDKTLTRRTEGDQVIYDGAAGGGSGGSSVVGSGTVVNAPVVNGIFSGSTSKYARILVNGGQGTDTVGYTVPSGISKIIFLGAGGYGSSSDANGVFNDNGAGVHTQYIGGSIPQNTGNYVNYSTTPRQYLGNDQNFQVMWGYRDFHQSGAFDDKVYIFAIIPAGVGIVWTSMTLLLI